MKYDVPLFAKVLYYSGCATLYHYGRRSEDVGFVNAKFKVWHPLTWLIYVGFIIPCAVTGEKISDVVPTKLEGYYKKNFKKVTHKDFL